MAGSPTWCPRAPGRPQGPSRPPESIGVARGGGHSGQISCIFCRFVLLRGVVPNKIPQLAESQNIWSPQKFRAGYATARGFVLKIRLA